MENRSHALAAGLFTLILGAAMVAVVLWFNKDELQLVRYAMYTTGSVTGLKSEAPVRYRGVDVGKVNAVHLESGNTGRVQIEIGVHPDTPVTKNTFAQLGYQGITGLAYVQLNEDGPPGEKLVEAGGKPAELRMKRSLFDDGETLFSTLSDIAGKVGNLLDKDGEEKLRSSLAGFEQLTQRAGTVVKKIEPALDALPALLTETRGLASEARVSLRRMDQVADNADRLLGSANQIALKIDQRIGTLDQVAGTARDAGAMVRTLNEESVPRVNALVDDLAREARAIDRAVDRVVTTVVEQPHGFIFGPSPPRAGPGEPGFSGGK